MNASWYALVLLGAGAGVLGGMFGIGGGVIMVSALILGFGASQSLATGTSLLAQLLPIGIGAVIVYQRHGHLDVRAGLLMAAGLLVGNLVGGWFANQTWVSPLFMKRAYGVLLIVLGLRFALSR